MKIQRVLSILAASALVLSAAALVGCQQAASTSSADYSGSARFTYPVHQTGVIADANVTTDKDGNITDAFMNEWQGPSAWAGTTAGTIIRFKMAGKYPTANNADATPNTAVRGYAFFYYNGSSKGWVELAPNSTTGIWTAPPTTGDTNNSNPVLPNLDLKMATPLYSLAYADASAAVTANPAATDLVVVTFSSGSGTVNPVFTVGSSAATLVAAIANTASLNKRTTASQYFPMNATNLGYRENYKAMLAFFKANPTANYAAAVTAKKALPALTTDFTVANTANYPAQTDDVWTVSDAVTGATYSDFPAYALGMQTAYLYAIGDTKGGNTRAAQF